MSETSSVDLSREAVLKKSSEEESEEDLSEAEVSEELPEEHLEVELSEEISEQSTMATPKKATSAKVTPKKSTPGKPAPKKPSPSKSTSKKPSLKKIDKSEESEIETPGSEGEEPKPEPATPTVAIPEYAQGDKQQFKRAQTIIGLNDTSEEPCTYCLREQHPCYRHPKYNKCAYCTARNFTKKACITLDEVPEETASDQEKVKSKKRKR